jgi:hypothetical protein
MALGTQNSRRFFGGGNSGIQLLHGVIESYEITLSRHDSFIWQHIRKNLQEN